MCQWTHSELKCVATFLLELALGDAHLLHRRRSFSKKLSLGVPKVPLGDSGRWLRVSGALVHSGATFPCL